MRCIENSSSFCLNFFSIFRLEKLLFDCLRFQRKILRNSWQILLSCFNEDCIWERKKAFHFLLPSVILVIFFSCPKSGPLLSFGDERKSTYCNSDRWNGEGRPTGWRKLVLCGCLGYFLCLYFHMICFHAVDGWDGFFESMFYYHWRKNIFFGGPPHKFTKKREIGGLDMVWWFCKNVA